VVNPLSAISWLWKALHGHSVTFAVLMAFGLLGVSAIHLKMGLGAVGVPWLLALILPTLVIGMFAKWERVWIPEEARRKFWARSILGASVAAALATALLRPAPTERMRATNTLDGSAAGGSLESLKKPVRPRGPSGK
jgi:hypothetical protein